jgi:hypothetical protein
MSHVITEDRRPLAWRALAADVSRRALVVSAVLLTLNALAVGGLGIQLGHMVDDASAQAVLVLAGWYLLRHVSWVAALLVWQPAVERACGRWRVRLLARALHQRIDVLGETSAGELADRIDDDTATTARTLAHSGLLGASAVVTAVVAAAIAGWTAPWAIPGFVATVVAVVVVTRWLGPEVARKREAVEAAWTDLSIVVEEAVAARDDVRAVAGRRHVLTRYGAACRRVIEREGVAAVGRANLHLGVSAVFAVAVCLVVVGAVAANRSGSLDVPTSSPSSPWPWPSPVSSGWSRTTTRNSWRASPPPAGWRRSRTWPSSRAASTRCRRSTVLRTAPSRCARSPSPTARPARRCCTAWTSPSRTAAPAAWSAGPARARARSSPCSPGRWTRLAAWCSSAVWTWSTWTCARSAAPWAWSPSAPSCWRPQWPRTCRCSRRCHAAASRRPSTNWRWATGWHRSPTAWTPASGPAASRSPPARSNWWRSPGCSCAIRSSSCWTKRPLAWTRSPMHASPAPRRGCSPVVPASSSPTGSPRCVRATTSP